MPFHVERLARQVATAARTREALGFREAVRFVAQAYLTRQHGKRISVSVPGLPSRVALRARTSDVSTFFQIFSRREYDMSGFAQARLVEDRYRTALSESRVPLIVDCGANIGLSSLWFAQQFPLARIVAIEPSVDNFEVLSANVAANPEIVPLNAAVWNTPARVRISNPDAEAWAFQVSQQESDAPGDYPTRDLRAVTIPHILAQHPDADLLLVKIDIEGGEKALFTSNVEWLRLPAALVIETHDHMLPYQMTSSTFYQAMAEHPVEVCVRGENTFVFFERPAASAGMARSPAASSSRH